LFATVDFSEVSTRKYLSLTSGVRSTSNSPCQSRCSNTEQQTPTPRLCPEHEQYQYCQHVSSATSLGGRNVDATSGLGMHCICCMHDQLACKCKVPRSNTDRRVSQSGVDTTAQQIFLTTRKKATGRETANIIHVAGGRGQWLAICCMQVRSL